MRQEEVNTQNTRVGEHLGDKIEKNEMGWVCGAYG
jgi:hypothetical protein